MSEEEKWEYELYRKMRYAINGPKGRFIPIELLMEWERVRLKINPNAAPVDLMKFEKVKINGGSDEL